jgi:2-keto-4-pentenoate hydratase/2-oxohepta-3-ene-1,7-dioic acid hydratase in catechol pathway
MSKDDNGGRRSVEALQYGNVAKMVKRENWRQTVFGYPSFIDVTARGEGRRTRPASQPIS